MITLVITCLFVATTIIALLCVSDSLIRGWNSYVAQASELRALRSSFEAAPRTLGAATLRRTGASPARRRSHRARTGSASLRAAA